MSIVFAVPSYQRIQIDLLVKEAKKQETQATVLADQGPLGPWIHYWYRSMTD